MTTTLYMVRHGSHDRLDRILCGRMDGVRLSAGGEAQAEAAGRRLAGRGVIALYASPLERTRQTADLIGRSLGLPVQEDAALIEIDFEVWNGAAFETLAGDPAWEAWNSSRDTACPPGGETMATAQARAVDFLRRACAAHAGEAIVAVTHSDVIKALILHVLHLPLQAYGRIEVEPGSISAIVAGDWGAKIHSINEVAA